MKLNSRFGVVLFFGIGQSYTQEARWNLCFR